MIVVLKQSFQLEPILFYSTGQINNNNLTLPPRTGLLGRPLTASSQDKKQQNPENNCFRVPLYFQTNRFTFKQDAKWQPTQIRHSAA